MLYLEVYNETAPYDFVKSKIKELFNLALNDILKNNDTENINNYLKENYKISLLTVLNSIKNNLLVIKQNNKSIIIIEDNYKLNNHLLKEFIGLLNYGNMKVKGLNLINKSFNFLKSKLYYLHFYYLLNKD